MLQAELRGVLENVSAISSANIQVVVAGPTVILRGRVADENERRLAEGLVRLTPGVHEVRNELRLPVVQSKATP